MGTKTLIEVIDTRIKMNDNNPTTGSLLYDLSIALKKLDKYEEREKKLSEILALYNINIKQRSVKNLISSTYCHLFLLKLAINCAD